MSHVITSIVSSSRFAFFVFRLWSTERCCFSTKVYYTLWFSQLYSQYMIKCYMRHHPQPPRQTANPPWACRRFLPVLKGSFSFSLSPSACSYRVVWLLRSSLYYCKVYGLQYKPLWGDCDLIIIKKKNKVFKTFWKLLFNHYLCCCKILPEISIQYLTGSDHGYDSLPCINPASIIVNCSMTQQSNLTYL